MTEYKCEDTSSTCSKFQSAICLHCNRRLCCTHIIEHNQVLQHDDELEKLLELVAVILQQIKNKAEKSRMTSDQALSSLDEWRTQQLENIERTYEHQLQFFDLRENVLVSFHTYLQEQLEQSTRPALERAQMQGNINIGILNDTRQRIEKIRETIVHLQAPLTLNLHSQIASLPIQTELPIIETQPKGKNTAIEQKSSTDKQETCHVQLTSPIKQLIDKFSNTLSIASSKVKIEAYIKKTKKLKLSVIVEAYLTACHLKTIADEKLLLLTKHISTIKRYVDDRKGSFDILIGIQTFFINNIFEENEMSEIMSFLLQFFLAHQCITHQIIADWYNGDQGSQYAGFEEAKQLAKTYIETFSTINGDLQAVIS